MYLGIQNTNNTQKPIENHKFWKTQPVMKETLEIPDTYEGSIENKKQEEIAQKPQKQPESFIWECIDVNDKEKLNEQYTLQEENYIEDYTARFRFNYSREFLLWALCPPGYTKEWHLGVRNTKCNKQVGFISAIPLTISCRNNIIKSVEVNFLCVHKSLRRKRLAPILIREVTRRVNLYDIWQALYTSGEVLPTPIGACNYNHRPLNPKKLLDVRFSILLPGEDMDEYIRPLELDTTTFDPSFHPQRVCI